MMETQPQQPGSPPPPRRGRLIRPHDSNLLAGVAIGISRWLDVPVWFVRVAFAALTITGGLGVLAYGAGWLFMPREGEATSIGHRLISDVERNRSWGAVALVAIGLMIFTGSTGFISTDLTFAAILIGIGVLLYRGRLGDQPTNIEAPEGAALPVTEYQPSSASLDPHDTGDTLQADVMAQAPPSPPTHPERRQPPSTLGRWTIAAALLTVGVMGLFDSIVTNFDPSARHYVGSFLGVLGLGLLVGAWRGRSRGLVFLGILMIPMLLATPFEDFDWSETRTRVTPTSLAELESTYEFEVGEAVIDLRQLDLDGADIDLTADMALGQLVILVPEDVSVDARAEARIGEAIALGRTSSGVGSIDASSSVVGANGHLDIKATIGVGQVQIGAGDEGRGHIDLVIDDPAQLENSYSLDVGSIRLDLSDLNLERTRTVDVTSDAGGVTIVLPRGTDTEVVGTVDVGSIRMPDKRNFGTELEDTYLSGDEEPVLFIQVTIDAGDLLVEESR